MENNKKLDSQNKIAQTSPEIKVDRLDVINVTLMKSIQRE